LAAKQTPEVLLVLVVVLVSVIVLGGLPPLLSHPCLFVYVLLADGLIAFQLSAVYAVLIFWQLFLISLYVAFCTISTKFEGHVAVSCVFMVYHCLCAVI